MTDVSERKHNYKMVIEYDGTNYFGWQRQKSHRNTIQEMIESSLTNILNKKIKITGAGRTDAGVHALNQVANFKTECIESAEKLRYSLNSVLPQDITIKKITGVKEEFHSRYSARKRKYVYQISLDKKSVQKDYYHKLIYKPDYSKIDALIPIFKGYHSFKSLCKNDSDKHNFCCNVYELKYVLKRSKGEIIFTIIADRFLHSMVRAVIGCVIDVSRGRLDLNHTIENFKKGASIRSTYLPAKGLFLKTIYY
ncbi:tRNA pseudouridine(38-40) synthase TruA [bacterium]|nr:MAG: tRNA pseudouridine(38-40) synthase TruA [bacterium]